MVNHLNRVNQKRGAEWFFDGYLVLATISKHKRTWARAQVPNQDLKTIQANVNQQQHHLQRLQRKLQRAASQLGIEWGSSLSYQPAPFQNISQGPQNHWHQLQRLIYLLQQCQRALELQHRHCAEQYQYLFYCALDNWESELDEFHVTPPPGRELLPEKEEWCEDAEEESAAEELVAAMAWDEINSPKSSNYAVGQSKAQPLWDSQAPRSSGDQVIPNPQESRWEEFEARDREYGEASSWTNRSILILGQPLSKGEGWLS